MEIEAKFNVSSDYSYEYIKMNYFLRKESHQIDYYFIVNEIINNKRTYLRLRKDILGNKYSLDHHQVISLYATEETEIPIENENDFNNFLSIFNTINIPVKCIIDKKRKVYEKDGVKILIDQIDSLGDFIEVEIIGEDTEMNRTRLEQEIETLNLDTQIRIKHIGYPDLYLKYIKS